MSALEDNEAKIIMSENSHHDEQDIKEYMTKLVDSRSSQRKTVLDVKIRNYRIKISTHLKSIYWNWIYAGDKLYFCTLWNSLKLLHNSKQQLPDNVKTCWCGSNMDNENNYIYDKELDRIEPVCIMCVNILKLIPKHMDRLKKYIKSPFYEWEYAGGASPLGEEDNKSYHKNYFNLKFDGKKQEPENKEFCGCGHAIVSNCYIYNPRTDELKTLGNCCVKKFIPNFTRTCSECKNIHYNTAYDICNDCKTKPRPCPCGGIFRIYIKKKHTDTQMHKRYLRSLNQ